MERIPILFLYSSKRYGGIVRNLSLIARHIDHSTFHVHVAVLQGADDRENELNLEGAADATLVKIPDSGKFDTQCVDALKKLIAEREIRVVSCHGYKADLYGFALKYLLRCPVRLLTIAHGWTYESTKMRLYCFLDKCLMRCFDRIVLVNEKQRKQLGTVGIRRDLVTVIPNAVNPRFLELQIDRQKSRSLFGIAATEFVISCVGRFSKEKGFATAIELVARLSEKGQAITLLLCGDGPEREELERMAEAVSARIIFTGFRSDVEHVYAASNVFLSTSVIEGLPNTLLEAQACALPCVASDVQGNNDVIADGTNGLLYPLGDMNALVAQIVALIVQPQRGEELGQRAKEMVGSTFSMATRIERLEQQYRALA